MRRVMQYTRAEAWIDAISECNLALLAVATRVSCACNVTEAVQDFF